LLTTVFVALMTGQTSPEQPVPPMRVRVLGSDAAELPAADLRRLFKGRHLTPARRHRLCESGRVVAVCGTRVVGLAAYEWADAEFRVHEFGIDADSPCRVEEIAAALIDALETACLAGAGTRLVLLPRASIGTAFLRERGYAPIAEGCAGSWFVKKFPA
jgi:hypothetical protein